MLLVVSGSGEADIDTLPWFDVAVDHAEERMRLDARLGEERFDAFGCTQRVLGDEVLPLVLELASGDRKQDVRVGRAENAGTVKW